MGNYYVLNGRTVEPANSISQGKRKSVRVSGVSSYQGQLKYSIF